MDFIPENEMGVIVRFSQEITYLDNVSLVSIRTQYPDAILFVNGEEIRTEFEYLSSNFVSHQHDPRVCDLIICWIDNVGHRNKLPTWELSNHKWKSLQIPKITNHQKEAWYWECRARRIEKYAIGSRNKLKMTNQLENNLPDWLPERPIDLAHFQKLVSRGLINLPPDLTGAELARIIDRSPRTGQNWLTAVRNGN